MITIKVQEICNKQILIRQQIVKLRDYILTLAKKEIILDFAGVEFMTRASADELVKALEYLKSKDYQIKIINLNNEPKEIFEIVGKK